MPQRRRSDRPNTFVWVRGLRGPEPQIWGEEALVASERNRETTVLSMRALAPEERKLSLGQLAARYPAPMTGDGATDE